MLNITRFSTFCVNFDYYADYVPGLSSATNFIDLFLKYAIRPAFSETSLKENHYFAYLYTKKPLQCILLLFPFIGNIYFVAVKIINFIGADEAENFGAELMARGWYSDALMCYENASNLGSIEGKFQYANCLANGIGLKEGVTFPDLAIKQYRAAAALGHPGALLALKSLSQR